jgi:hypothetical protein
MSMSVETTMTGRRPKMLPSGTHQMFEAPSMSTLIYNERASVSAAT